MKFVAVMVSLLVAFAVPAAASDMKIGVVDFQKALNASKAGIAAKEKMTVEVKKVEDILMQRQEELKALQNELQTQAMMLSQEARSEKERSYQQKVKDYQRFAKDKQEAIQQRESDYTREILDGLFIVIKEMGNKEGYTLILERSKSSVLFADDAIDLTGKLIETFDATSDGKHAN